MLTWQAINGQAQSLQKVITMLSIGGFASRAKIDTPTAVNGV